MSFAIATTLLRAGQCVQAPPWPDLGSIMTPPPVRIQICGQLAVEVDGIRRDSMLPGRQGRLLLTYLVVHRHEAMPRSHLASALWPAGPPNAADAAVYALLSKCR